jgi:hypothetical protein
MLCGINFQIDRQRFEGCRGKPLDRLVDQSLDKLDLLLLPADRHCSDSLAFAALHAAMGAACSDQAAADTIHRDGRALLEVTPALFGRRHRNRVSPNLVAWPLANIRLATPIAAANSSQKLDRFGSRGVTIVGGGDGWFGAVPGRSRAPTISLSGRHQPAVPGREVIGSPDFRDSLKPARTWQDESRQALLWACRHPHSQQRWVPASTGPPPTLKDPLREHCA